MNVKLRLYKLNYKLIICFKMTLILTADELANLKDYKHQADKTTMETYYVNHLLVPVEKAIPKHWSANTVTLIG